MADGIGWLALAQQASLPTLSFAALLLAIVAFIRVLPQLRQTQMEGDNSLRSDLLGRIEYLEEEVKSLRKAMHRKEVQHAAEIADLQHDLNSEMMSLDAFILLAEDSPEKVLEHIPKIKELRQQHRARVALKRGAREGAAGRVSDD